MIRCGCFAFGVRADACDAGVYASCAGFEEVQGDWLHRVNAYHGQTHGAPGSRYFYWASVA